MNDDRDLIPPEQDTKHKGQLVFKGALGAIPIAGGLVGETFDIIWKSGYEKRLENWRLAISKELSKKYDDSNIAKLARNEEFQSLVAESTIIALKNHQKLKLQAILNLVINSTESPIEYDFKKLFLDYIDQFTAYHLRSIGVIKENLNLIESNSFLTYNDHMKFILENVFHGDAELRGQVFEELMAVKGLITKKTDPIGKRGNKKYYCFTALGQKFVDLIFINETI